MIWGDFNPSFEITKFRSDIDMVADIACILIPNSFKIRYTRKKFDRTRVWTSRKWELSYWSKRFWIVSLKIHNWVNSGRKVFPLYKDRNVKKRNGLNYMQTIQEQCQPHQSSRALVGSIPFENCHDFSWRFAQDWGAFRVSVKLNVTKEKEIRHACEWSVFMRAAVPKSAVASMRSWTSKASNFERPDNAIKEKVSVSSGILAIIFASRRTWSSTKDSSGYTSITTRRG